ncbi:MAG: putative lipid II flippase FtsW [Christensenellales bacterium]|jgi:cell division protein FtsW
MAKRSFDYSLLIITIILVLFGIVMVFSASFYYAEHSANTGYNGYYYFWKQVSGAGLGIVAMVTLMLFDYNKLKKLRFWILGAGLLLMVLVFVPGIGIKVNGSSRWVNLYILDLQSVEVLKFAIIVFMAGGISNSAEKMHTFRYGMLPYLVLLAISGLLLYLQPNFSAVVTLALMMFVMMLVGGANLFHFGAIGLGGLGVGALAMVATEDAGYRVDRILAFLDPWAYSSDQSYQLVQSLYSIGSGGLFGLGLGNSRQKFLFLPYSESDCIFAIVVEELGFVGGILLIAVFAIFIWRGVRIALRAPNTFGMMLATGITAVIAIQVFINIGVVTGCVPPTGVALPFISAGRTQLIMFMASVGVLLNISRQSRAA